MSPTILTHGIIKVYGAGTVKGTRSSWSPMTRATRRVELRDGQIAMDGRA